MKKFKIILLFILLCINSFAQESFIWLVMHWRQEHFVVVYDIKVDKRTSGQDDKKTRPLKDYVRVADPAHGLSQFDTISAETRMEKNTS
jgi:hypothetical protein